jgi:hypothetical protein
MFRPALVHPDAAGAAASCWPPPATPWTSTPGAR